MRPLQSHLSSSWLAKENPDIYKAASSQAQAGGYILQIPRCLQVDSHICRPAHFHLIPTRKRIELGQGKNILTSFFIRVLYNFVKFKKVVKQNPGSYLPLCNSGKS